jgi:hypothetical protein
MTSIPAAGAPALSAGRRALLAAAFCAGAAWLAGPAGRMVVALALLLLAPGYLIERALPRPRHPALIRCSLWVGLSLSATVLLYEWLWLLRIPLLAPALLLLAGGLALAALACAWRDLGPAAGEEQPAARNPQPWAWALFALVCLATLFARFAQIADLALPAWVDSVHHALLVRLAAERGLVPTNLEPALPIAELAYHWGYHVVMAALMQLSGLDLAQTLLWAGQILNALVAPLSGALALLLWRRPSAAVVAALVAGLLSLFPAYYVSWGRYTQLTGLLLVPALAAAWLAALDCGGRGRWAAVALLIAGLFLIHVRVLIFALVMLAALTLPWALRSSPARLRAALAGAALAALATAALASPWLLLLARRVLLPAVAPPLRLAAESSYTALNTGLLWAESGRALVALALVALLWGLWRRHAAAAALAVWAGVLVLLTDPGLLAYLLPAAGAPLLVAGLGRRRPALLAAGALLIVAGPFAERLPTTWLVSGDSVVIVLFLPISAVIGGAAAGLLARARAAGGRLAALAGPVFGAAVVALTLWGAYDQRDVLNRGTVIAGAADLAAIEWARANTAPDARFLINVAPWLGAAPRGVDGGWWLLPLAGRWTSLPPAIFAYGAYEYVVEVRDRNAVVLGYKPGGEQAILDLIRRDGIDYIYLSERAGPLTAAALSALPGLRPVYAADGVVILAVLPQS